MFNSSAALVHSQLVCLLRVGILKLLSLFQLLVSLALKSPSGEWSITYVYMYAFHNPLPPSFQLANLHVHTPTRVSRCLRFLTLKIYNSKILIYMIKCECYHKHYRRNKTTNQKPLQRTPQTRWQAHQHIQTYHGIRTFFTDHHTANMSSHSFHKNIRTIIYTSKTKTCVVLYPKWMQVKSRDA